jgi:hypothetical protein
METFLEGLPPGLEGHLGHVPLFIGKGQGGKFSQSEAQTLASGCFSSALTGAEELLFSRMAGCIFFFLFFMYGWLMRREKR